LPSVCAITIARASADRLASRSICARVGAEIDVDEHRHQAVEDDRVHRGREPGATVITSSPARSRRSPRRGDNKVDTARRFADDPELQRCA
jgi:hypothetical protein